MRRHFDRIIQNRKLDQYGWFKRFQKSAKEFNLSFPKDPHDLVTSRQAKSTGERIVRLGRFFQDILNLSKHTLALVDDLDARIKGILSE